MSIDSLHLCGILYLIMNGDISDAGGAEAETVVRPEGDDLQPDAVDFPGQGGGGGGGEGGKAFADAGAGIFDIAFFGRPDIEKVPVVTAAEVLIFLWVEETGGNAFPPAFGMDLDIQPHLCGSHGTGPVFTAVADGKMKPVAVREVRLSMAAFPGMPA